MDQQVEAKCGGGGKELSKRKKGQATSGAHRFISI